MKPFINIEVSDLPSAFLELYQEFEKADREWNWYKKESYKFNTPHDEILEVESRVEILDVLAEPMLSFIFPILSEFPEYVSDVLLGTKDHGIGKGYNYTYHERTKDQIGYVIRKLGEAPYSNRAQFTTWIPERDSNLGGPPCLQRGWFKVLKDRKLHLETDWRSREFVYAWPENVVGMAGLALLVRKCLVDYYHLPLEEGIGYIDKCNSLHVYKDKYGDFQRTLKTIKNRGMTECYSDDNRLLEIWKGKKLFWAVDECKKTVFDSDPMFEPLLKK